MRYAVVHTVSIGSKRRHIVTHWVDGAPETATVADVTAALAESEHAPALTEYGSFLASRRVLAESRVPDGAGDPDGGPALIAWDSLVSATKSAQVNVRVRPADRARWQAAAKGAGLSLAAWMERELNRAASAPE